MTSESKQHHPQQTPDRGGYLASPVRRLLEIARRNPSLAVRCRIASVLSTIRGEEPNLREEAFKTLALDPVPAVRDKAASSLQEYLAHADGLYRSRLVSAWSTSDHAGVREVIARALGAPVETVGAATAIQHLSLDPVAEVRIAAAASAAERVALNPPTYLGVLSSLAQDDRPAVRSAALDGLTKVAQQGFAKDAIEPLERAVLSPDEKTALRAAAGLARCAHHAPERVIHAIDRVTVHPQDIDPKALAAVIEPVDKLGTVADGETSRRILRRLSDHPAPWVAGPASRAFRRSSASDREVRST